MARISVSVRVSVDLFCGSRISVSDGFWWGLGLRLVLWVLVGLGWVGLVYLLVVSLRSEGLSSIFPDMRERKVMMCTCLQGVIVVCYVY